jgi:putative ATPase
MPDQSSNALFPEMRDAMEHNARSKTAAPLADRMRPRTLSEFVGQQHLVGEGRVLRRLIEGGATMPSLILWGPPGTGKTTLARLLAEKADARFIALSAGFLGRQRSPRGNCRCPSQSPARPSHDSLHRRDSSIQ